MPKKTGLDPHKVQDLLYKIGDITEISIRVIDSINCVETNQLRTILEAQRHFNNKLQCLIDGEETEDD